MTTNAARLRELVARDHWLFDLDGTLIDTVPDIAGALNRLLSTLDLAPIPHAQVRDWVGTGSRVLIATALRARGAAYDDALLDALLARYAEDYERNAVVDSTPYPDARELVTALAARGARLAIVTNKLSAVAREVLRRFDLAPHFATVVGFDDTPRGKPDPAPLYEAARRLDVAPGTCVFVGDSRNDVRAARAAGVPVIAVSYGYNHGEPIAREDPDVVVDSLGALL